jgi:UDP-2,4-diacetamido-2,4,6-trideoxy-beta-L-altropyranose hydrolase
MIALAQAWQDSGGESEFLCAEIPAALEARLLKEGFYLRRIDVLPGSSEDVSAICDVISEQPEFAPIIILDGYHFDSAFQLALKEKGCCVVVVDDYGHTRFYHADCILNQNLSAVQKLYTKRNCGTRLLLGAKFTMLRKEFLQYRGIQRPTPARAQRILVTLGGSDPNNVTQQVIEVLANLDVEIKVLVGGSNPHLPILVETLRSTPHLADIEIISDSTDIAGWMVWADLAVTGGGSTSWELAFMGVPMIQLILAENQIEIVNACTKLGVSECGGDLINGSLQHLADVVNRLRDDSQLRHDFSKRGARLIDGFGAQRVVQAFRHRLEITILSDAESWFRNYVDVLKTELVHRGHSVRSIVNVSELHKGDIAFFISLGKIVPADRLAGHCSNLVVHESNLPEGRGWSPLTWQILEGKNEICVTLLEAAQDLDAGDIYDQEKLFLNGGELVDELRAAQAATTIKLCLRFVDEYPYGLMFAREQDGLPTFYRRRKPEDSRIDVDGTIRQQFNLLRVCDYERYPAFFEMNGSRYKIKIERIATSCP